MDLTNKKFLICDDSLLARKKIKDIISSMGATEIFEAYDGEQAVSMYKINKPDITFLDIIMPKKEGTDALEEIIAFDPNAKVIMASSVGTQSYLAKAIEVGACNFLQKPIDSDELIKVLASVLGGEK